MSSARTSSLLLGLVIFPFGCLSDRPCPDPWGDLDPTDESICVPPAPVVDAVAARVETGIFGYAVECTEEGDDACECDEQIALLEGGGEFLLEDLETHGESSVTVRITADSTFEASATPGIEYRVFQARTDDPHVGPVRERNGAFATTIVLSPGELRFLVVTINPFC